MRYEISVFSHFELHLGLSFPNNLLCSELISFTNFVQEIQVYRRSLKKKHQINPYKKKKKRVRKKPSGVKD